MLVRTKALNLMTKIEIQLVQLPIFLPIFETR